MTFRRTWGLVLCAALSGALLLPACNRRKPAEVNPITPSIKVNRTKAPARQRARDHVHLEARAGREEARPELLGARALPGQPRGHAVLGRPPARAASSTWEPGKSYSYTRTRFVPVYPYVGDVEVRMGLYPYPGPGRAAGAEGRGQGLPGVQGRHPRAAAPDGEHLPRLQGGLAQPGDAPGEPERRAHLDEEGRARLLQEPEEGRHRLPRGRHLREVLRADARADDVGREQRRDALRDRRPAGLLEEDPGQGAPTWATTSGRTSGSR